MTINIDRVLKIAGTISGILILGFGISLATVREKVVDIVKVPPIVKELETRLIILEEMIHPMIDVHEMDWELMRLMTDNTDSTDLYEFADDVGNAYDVDIRETAEGVRLAFVFKMYIVYPMGIDTNGRLFIMLHHSDKQNTYLFKKNG